jgi:hypothetical protein
VDCRTDTAVEEVVKDVNPSQPIYPAGPYKMNLWGEACEYRNNGHNEGTLYCSDKEIECTTDVNYENPPSTDLDADKSYICGEDMDKIRQAMITCPF